MRKDAFCQVQGCWIYLWVTISDDLLKDRLLCSTCGQGVLLNKARWSQYVRLTPLLLDGKTSPPTEEEEQLLIQLQFSSRNTVFLTQEPSVQVYTEQPGQEAAVRQTNDTCYRTKTIQNNFINSVTFLLCTSVQPYPSSLLLKIHNACFLFRFFPKRQTQNQPSVHYLQKCNTVSHPEIKLFTNKILPTERK